MSGHSHWAKVKRAKAVTDARRGKQWSKLARRIIVAAKGGGGNPDENLMLRYAIDEARAASMPNDTIDKAIKKGTGSLGAENYEPVMYEGYGPGGVAFMVECLTDNRHRTAPEMRLIFERYGGQLGASNSVAWMFEHKGVLDVSGSADEDAVIQAALDAGADDVVRDGEYFRVSCGPTVFAAVKQALAKAGLPAESSQLGMVPKSGVPVSGEKAERAMKLAEALEENDDVQNVYSNFEIPDESVPGEGAPKP